MGGRNGQGVIRVQTDEPTVEYAGQICSWGTEGRKWYCDEPKKERDQRGVHGAIGGTDIHIGRVQMMFTSCPPKLRPSSRQTACSRCHEAKDH